MPRHLASIKLISYYFSPNLHILSNIFEQCVLWREITATYISILSHLGNSWEFHFLEGNFPISFSTVEKVVIRADKHSITFHWPYCVRNRQHDIDLLTLCPTPTSIIRATSWSLFSAKSNFNWMEFQRPFQKKWG